MPVLATRDIVTTVMTRGGCRLVARSSCFARMPRHGFAKTCQPQADPYFLTRCSRRHQYASARRLDAYWSPGGKHMRTNHAPRVQSSIANKHMNAINGEVFADHTVERT